MKTWMKVSFVAVLGFGVGFGVISSFLPKRESALETAEGAAAGKADDGKPKEIEWGALRELDLATGAVGEALKGIDGAKVRIPGFIVPLEDNQKEVTEFLLVPSPQACVHVPAPPANQMVHVKMAGGRKAELSFGPVWLQGRIRITDVMGPYGKSSFEMTGELTEPYM